MNALDKAPWLEDFYNRFEAETRQLYKTEPFWRACHKCPDGYCCSQVIYSTQVSEGNPFLIEDWTRMLKYVRDVFSSADKARLAKAILSENKTCIFFDNRRCSIYPSRPWSCRTHPYTVSFHPNAGLFPYEEIALPSCPEFAASFGLKPGQLFVQRTSVITREEHSSLVKLKLKKHRPIWVLDASAYIKEYESHIPLGNRPVSDWLELFALAKEAGGGEQGEILSRHVEKITRRRP